MHFSTEGLAAAGDGVHYWLACTVFVVTFALIVSEKVHKTKVALAAAAATLVLSILSQEEAFHSPTLGIDYSVIFLLISMMLIVNVMGKSGIFEWTAVKVAKLAKGQPLAILTLFVVLTAVVSALLDNVTTVLLVAPVTLLITDQLELNPFPFLIGQALASNIGGTATLIGDPPNLMIGSRARLTFLDFVVHLAPVVAVILAVFVAVIWLFYRGRMKVTEERRRHVMGMNEQKLIKDPKLVKQSLFVLAVVMLGFLTHSWTHIEPATVALAGAALLLLLSDVHPHKALAEVEWPTIFFFMGLYIVIGGVVKVGMVSDLSQMVIRFTHPTAESMLGTSMVILWFSGFLSAFIDNIPYVATMAPLVGNMAGNVFHHGLTLDQLPPETLHHPVLMPVWWALALGACLGGNGTAIGASANVVVLGIAERAGHKISFLKFMLYGMPVMVLSLLICTAYIYLRYY